MICWGRGVILMVCLFCFYAFHSCTKASFKKREERKRKEEDINPSALTSSPKQILYRLLTPLSVSHMLTGASYDYHCHSNLVRAVLPYGLTEFDVHDVLNVFQVTGLDAQGRYFMESSPATPASSMTWFAEQDLLCALSTCPGGDLSAWGWHQADEDAEGGGKPDMKSTCRPIRVEVWEVREGVREAVLEGWLEPERSGYRGLHGMGVPEGEK
jgi:hypothetical protein